ncbi:helix-turn-helix transcriptional regulator [Kitasatospora sp. NPDC004272]
MGRPERPVTTEGTHLAELALWLRSERHRAGVTYRVMAAGTGYSVSTFSRAAAGNLVPTDRVVQLYAQACGSDLEKARMLRRRAAREEYLNRRLRLDFPSGFRPPRPQLVIDEAELRQAMRYLLLESGLSLRQVEQVSRDRHTERGGGYWLPRSTLGAVVKGNLRPTLRVVMALAEACDVPEADLVHWEHAWERVHSRLMVEAWEEDWPTIRKAAGKFPNRLPYPR